MRAVVGANPLPAPAPLGWRERLEAVYRLRWQLYQAHPWLTELTSVTRPLLAPEAMMHSEWTLDALAELPLAPPDRARTALALPALVYGLALGALGEVRAEQETQLRNEQWWATIEMETSELVHGGAFPRLAELGATGVDRYALGDMEQVFEHALAHYLDGLAASARQPVPELLTTRDREESAESES